MIIRVVLGLSILLLAVVLVGCGGSTSSDPSPTATAIPIPPTVTPSIIEPTTEPTTTPVNQPTDSTKTPPATSGGMDQTELINEGKILFESTAGGVGCALCHGLDGMGNPELATPMNRGASAEMIWEALANRPQMSFLVLSNDEVRAVEAYLQVLGNEP